MSWHSDTAGCPRSFGQMRVSGGQAPLAPERLTLEAIDNGAVHPDARRVVYIWSGEHCAYWRPDGCGYTTSIETAGLYRLDEAYRRTRHCGPEKQISYELAQEPRDLAELADETGVVAKWLGHAADALADDVMWEIAEPLAAANALERLEPLAERLAAVIADLRRHRGGVG